MASNETAALVVALSAQMSKFQKDMDQAIGIADKGVKKIEDRFAKLNPGAGLNFGKLLGANLLGNQLSQALLNPLDFAIGQIKELRDEMSRIPTLAKVLGLTSDKVQELSFAGKIKGLDFSAFAAGAENLKRQLDESKRIADQVGTLTSKQINTLQTDLARLFAANSVSLKDAQGKVISIDEAMARLADLVRNAKTEFDKIRIVEMAGLTRDWVRVLEGGGDAFRQNAAAARDVGAVIDKDILDKAKQFDRDWTAGWAKFEAKSKATIANIAAFISDKLTPPNQGQGGLFASIIAWFTLKYGTPEERERMLKFGPPSTGPKALPPPSEPAAAIGPGGPADSGGGTVVPVAKTRLDNAFTSEVQQFEKRKALLDVETEAIGKNTFEKEKARATTELLQAAEHAGLVVTDEMRAKIDAVAEAYGRAAKKAEEAKGKFDGINDAMRFFGNQAATIFDGLLNQTTTFRDAMVQTLRSLQNSLLQAAFTGEGAFAKIFGTASTTGGVGGIAGILSSLITGRAGGGPVSAGMPYVIGEHGPEIMVPQSAGMVLPNGVMAMGGGSSMMNTFHISVASDATSGDPTAAAQTGRAIRRELEGMVISLMSQQRRSGGVLNPR